MRMLHLIYGRTKFYGRLFIESYYITVVIAGLRHNQLWFVLSFNVYTHVYVGLVGRPISVL